MWYDWWERKADPSGAVLQLIRAAEDGPSCFQAPNTNGSGEAWGPANLLIRQPYPDATLVHVQARRLGRVLRRRRRAFGAPPARFTDGPLAGLTLELPPRHAENFREYEPAMARALIRLAQPGNVCADVGAHFGYFTYALARRVDRLGRVVAFEAAAENARVIEHNVRRNALGNRVEVVHAAVADRHGERLKLFAGRNGGSMEWTLSGEFARRGGLDDQGGRDPG